MWCRCQRQRLSVLVFSETVQFGLHVSQSLLQVLVCGSAAAAKALSSRSLRVGQATAGLLWSEYLHSVPEGIAQFLFLLHTIASRASIQLLL